MDEFFHVAGFFRCPKDSNYFSRIKMSRPKYFHRYIFHTYSQGIKKMAGKDYSKYGHIKSQYPLGDIQRDYLFVVEFELPNILQPYLGSSDDGLFNQLTMTCRSAPIVGITNTPIPSNWFGMEQFFAGKSVPSTTSVQMNFEEFEGVASGEGELDANGMLKPSTQVAVSPRQLFQAWSTLTQNISYSGVGVPKADLIGKVRVTPLRANLQQSGLGTQVLNSAWVESFGDMDFAYANSGASTNTVTIKFDYPTTEAPSDTRFQRAIDLIKQFNLDGKAN